MTKERIVELETYKQFIEGRLSTSTPEKHRDHPETFKAYLLNELRLVKDKLDAARMEMTK